MTKLMKKGQAAACLFRSEAVDLGQGGVLWQLLCFDGNQLEEQQMFSNITVAIDGSDHGWRALDVACDLAKHYGSNVHVIHVPEMPTTGIAVGAGAVEIPVDVEHVMTDGQAVMAEAATHARKHDVEPASQIVRPGVPSVEVLHTADATSSDLIVTGRRGMGGVASLVLGSTSQKIAHDAQCACLTVK